jgi:hypothetical protein
LDEVGDGITSLTAVVLQAVESLLDVAATSHGVELSPAASQILLNITLRMSIDPGTAEKVAVIAGKLADDVIHRPGAHLSAIGLQKAVNSLTEF